MKGRVENPQQDLNGYKESAKVGILVISLDVFFSFSSIRSFNQA